jgi:hypothetical protein
MRGRDKLAIATKSYYRFVCALISPDPSFYPPTKLESLVLTTLLKMEPKV